MAPVKHMFCNETSEELTERAHSAHRVDPGSNSDSQLLLCCPNNHPTDDAMRTHSACCLPGAGFDPTITQL